MKSLLVIIPILFRLSGFSQQINPSKNSLWNASCPVNSSGTHILSARDRYIIDFDSIVFAIQPLHISSACEDTITGLTTLIDKMPTWGWNKVERYDTSVRASMLVSWDTDLHVIRGYVIRQAQEYNGDRMPNGIPGYYDTRWEAIGYLDTWKAPLNKDVIVWNVKIAQ